MPKTNQLPARRGGPPRRDESPARHDHLAGLLARLATREGVSASPLDGVRFLRASRFYPRRPVIYEPGIVILAQGRKRGFLDGEVYTYDASHYLVVSLPLPFECETQPPPGGPLLGLKVRIDLGVLGELMLKAGPGPALAAPRRAAMYASPLEPALADAAARLLGCLSDERETAVLGPQIVREITWRVLRGQRGESLRSLATMHGRVWPLHRVLQRLHDDYARPFEVAALAREAAMSVSAFHQHFRGATGTSPLRYVKTVRLQKARLLMAHEGVGASEAAARVGYESASQFNREFKRLFGHPPRSEAARLREAWDLQGHVPAATVLV